MRQKRTRKNKPTATTKALAVPVKPTATATPVAMFDLRPEQIIALHVLAAGGTITSAAKAAGVGRPAVHDWLRRDFKFQAAFNGLKREMANAVAGQVLCLAPMCVDVIKGALARKNVKVALRLLEGIGLIARAGNTSGSDDPQQLERDAAIRQQEERERMVELAESRNCSDFAGTIAEVMGGGELGRQHSDLMDTLNRIIDGD
jgi:hypothetical protein